MLIPIEQIAVDRAFNGRQDYHAQKLRGLTESMRRVGLLQPVVVQLISSFPDGSVTLLPEKLIDGKLYYLVSGFRRMAAWVKGELGDSIDCKVIEGRSISDLTQINAIENLERVDIRPSEEMLIVQRLSQMGFADSTISVYLNRPLGWVQERRMLSELPQVVVTAADDDRITMSNVRTLYRIRKDGPRMVATLVSMKEGHEKADSKSLARLVNPDRAAEREKLDFRGSRTIRETEAMIVMLLSAQPNRLITKALAWTTGGLSTREFLLAIPDMPIPENFPISELV